MCGKENAELVAARCNKRFPFVVACLVPDVYEARLR
jgi:hypothetical protein